MRKTKTKKMSIILRLAISIPLILLTCLICFVLLEMRPGDFVTSLSEQGLSSEDYALYLREILQIHLSPWKKFTLWVLNMIKFHDLGISFLYRIKIFKLIAAYLWNTVLFFALITSIKWIVAIFSALCVILGRIKLVKFLIYTIARLSVSTPTFFLALLCLYWSFSFPLIQKYTFLFAVFVGVLGGFGDLFHVLSVRFQEILEQPYIRALYIQGFSQKAIFLKLLRHANSEIVSIIGYDIPLFFSSSLIISMVFNLATLGPLFQKALLAHDTYLIMGIILVSCILIQICSLIINGIMASYPFYKGEQR